MNRSEFMKTHSNDGTDDAPCARFPTREEQLEIAVLFHDYLNAQRALRHRIAAQFPKGSPNAKIRQSLGAIKRATHRLQSDLDAACDFQVMKPFFRELKVTCVENKFYLEVIFDGGVIGSANAHLAQPGQPLSTLITGLRRLADNLDELPVPNDLT